MTNVKYGKAPATVDHRDLLLTEFEIAGKAIKQAPVGFGHYGLFPSDGWGMLANDQYGDCVWAGAAHETMLLNKIVGVEVEFSDASVLADYSAVTGFDPNDPEDTDQGTDMRNAMGYRRSTGVGDAQGGRHKIAAYCSIEPGNFGQHLQALMCFDVVAIGIDVPESAERQFQAHKPWTYVRDKNIVGGHYICIVGRPTTESLDIVTWGQIQRLTKSFLTHYNDESFGFFTEESLKNGRTAEGFDISALRSAIKEL